MTQEGGWKQQTTIAQTERKKTVVSFNLIHNATLSFKLLLQDYSFSLSLSSFSLVFQPRIIRVPFLSVCSRYRKKAILPDSLQA
jgi:hypothetical protein